MKPIYTHEAAQTTEIVYTWPDGREEVRYRRAKDSKEALEMIDQITMLQSKHGEHCPYSWRHVS